MFGYALTMSKNLTFALTSRQTTQWVIKCSKLTLETLEQGAKYVQS